jgi:hypothetical protein
MPDLIRHPVFSWIPASAGMTTLRYLTAGVIYPEIGAIVTILAKITGYYLCFGMLFMQLWG